MLLDRLQFMLIFIRMTRNLLILLPILWILSSFNGFTDLPEKELVVPRQTKKHDSKILLEEGQTYFMELVKSYKGQLELKLVDSMRYPYKTIIARFENIPLQGAVFVIKSPFAKGLSFGCSVNTFSEGYTKFHAPVVHKLYRKVWPSRSVFGIILSDFRLME